MKAPLRVLAIAAAAAAAACVLVLLLVRPAAPLNVILISIDTLRPDRMGVYGHRPLGRSTTPFLDELAASGAVFERAVSSSSWTLPAHWSLLTGTADAVHGMVNDRVPPPSGLPTLAELLRAEGYATAGVYSGPYLDPLFGFDRGFDRYEACMDLRNAAEEERRPARAGGEDAPATRFSSHELVTSQAVSQAGFELVKERAGRPFFLFLHYFDVHNDYLPPAPFDSLFGPPYRGWVNGRGVTSDPRYRPDMDRADFERLLALYDGEVAWVDQNIRSLFQRIESLDTRILENTLVVVLSDHGEEFFEHGRLGHRKNLYDCLVRVPLVLSCPGRIPAGQRIKSAASICDVLPTILDVLDIPAPESCQGRSLVPALESGELASRPALLDLTQAPKGGSFTRFTGVVLGALKLISTQERQWSADAPALFAGPLISESHALFDLDADPAELRDLAPREPELLKRMLATRDALLEEAAAGAAKVRRPAQGAGREVPEHLRRRLEELGYAGGR